uniref:Probable malate:quinone oxidoreductase n=2 Tax=Cacopsylla melanoneura TaxID=428564 RepID=A0A8D9EDA9_9HEMI
MSFYIAIIGAGVVSAITNLMLYLINNKNKIIVFELNKKIALENSRVINNAGTGHAGMCENNYVKVINNEYFVKKNIRIFCKFNLTKNFFSWIKIINIFNFKNILTKTPHVSFFFFKKNIKITLFYSSTVIKPLLYIVTTQGIEIDIMKTLTSQVNAVHYLWM